MGGYTWVQGQGEYFRLLSADPDDGNENWEGRTDGALYQVGYLSVDGSAVLPGPTVMWMDTEPWVAIPDPRVLAEQAVASMGFRAVDIGIVPEDSPESLGTIGLPQWMWVEDPGESTTGPITRSASVGGYTVTATGVLDRIEWEMGDGNVVTCSGPGTPYADSYGASDSPTCGHRYEQQGTYDVNATSYWVISWSGMGQSGTIPLDFSNSTTIRMGEVQVLVQ
ncbi:hypothetical protein K0651_13295 [Ornithinimicrobium sp. Arc0846-15]|nr:hypothetical protein [Ornithinimicrobium laminariae]